MNAHVALSDAYRAILIGSPVGLSLDGLTFKTYANNPRNECDGIEIWAAGRESEAIQIPVNQIGIVIDILTAIREG